MGAKSLNQLYREQLIRVGVKPKVAEGAASVLTTEELYLIKDIWSEWATILARFEEENGIVRNQVFVR